MKSEASSRWRWVTGPGGAATAFGLLLVASVPLALDRGRGRWFLADDWTFLQERQLDSVADLMRDHNDHWVAVPLVAYRLMYAAFGIRSYLPYQLLAILTHLAVVVLLRLIMRRAGVGPWTATLVAAVLVAFGPGVENIVSAFQITFTMGLALALAQLVVADVEDASWLRQGVAVGLGILGVASSGVAIPIVAGTGAALALRWGWRRALIQVGPVAAVYALWFVVHPSTSTSTPRPNVAELLRWMRESLLGAADGVAAHPVMIAALVATLVAGTAFALADAGGSDSPSWVTRAATRFSPAAPAWGLAAAGLAFTGLSGWGRYALGLAGARGSRYIYITVALLLPWLAVAVSALVRRERRLAPVLVVVIAAPVLANLPAARWDGTGFPVAVHARQEWVITSILRVPEGASAPSGLQPIPPVFGDLSPTMGFIRQAERSGKLDVDDAPLSADQRFELRHLLLLEQLTVAQRPDDCVAVVGPVPPSPHRAGDRYWFSGPLTTTSVDTEDAARTASSNFFPTSGPMVEVVRDVPKLSLAILGEGELWRCGRQTP